MIKTRALIFLFLFLPSWISAETVNIHVMNVGYGSAVFVEVGARMYLFDTGGEETASKVIQELADRMVTRLDAIFLTHAHPDHVGALARIVSQIRTEKVFWNDRYPPNEETVAILDRAAEITEFEKLEPGRQIPFGQETNLLVYNQEMKTQDYNDNSLVYGIMIGKRQILIPGDIQVERQKELARLYPKELKKTVWLLWPHHGDNLAPELIKALPKKPVCVISVGENSYGMPVEGLNSQAESFCRQVFRTDQNGDLSFIINNQVTYIQPGPSEMEKDPFYIQKK